MTPFHPLYFAHIPLLAVFAGFLWLGIAEARDSWRRASVSQRWAIPAISLALLLGVSWATRDTLLRGGYANGHEFDVLGLNFFDLSADSRGRFAMFTDKEASPAALRSLLDFAGGFTISGLIAGQKLLWLLCGLLIYGTSRRLGLGPWSSLFSVGLFCFNFLAILCTYSFATTNVNLFYLLCAVYALAGFLQSAPEEAARRLTWFVLCALLVLTSRYEFFPVLLWGFGLGLVFGGAPRLGALWRRGGQSRLLPAVLAVLTGLACLLWGLTLPHLPGVNLQAQAPLGQAPGNLIHHLGRQNLEPLFGLPAFWSLPLAGGLALLSAWSVWRGRRAGWGLPAFALLFLTGWGAYFCAVYAPHSGLAMHTGSRLYNMRHDLYFFLPFAFLGGLSAHAIGSLTPAFRGRALLKSLACLGLLAAYGRLGLRQVQAVSGDWGTNDRELQFLYHAARDWPSECAATYPVRDFRYWILRKYFPFRDLREISRDGCYLAYLSPVHQIFHDPDNAMNPGDFQELYGTPWREERFRHRFFVNPMASEAGVRYEIQEPVPVRMGFYRLPSGTLSLMLARQAAQGPPSKARGGRPYKGVRDRLAGLRIEQARADIAAGRRDRALRRLADARALGPSPDWAHDIALAYQDLQEHGKALEILGALVVNQPANALYRKDKGVCEYFRGSRQAAVGDLRAAIAMDPGLLSAYVSLGALYRQEGRLRESLEILDRALAVKGSQEAEVLRPVLRQMRRQVQDSLRAGGAG